MGFIDKLFNSISDQSRSSSSHNVSQHVCIKCATCGSDNLLRESKETISCKSCGRQYTIDEARKAMGTTNCRDCIYHSINLYDVGITEYCVIWGLDKCRSRCDRKATQPPHRWTDANRWERN